MEGLFSLSQQIPCQVGIRNIYNVKWETSMHQTRGSMERETFCLTKRGCPRIQPCFGVPFSAWPTREPKGNHHVKGFPFFDTCPHGETQSRWLLCSFKKHLNKTSVRKTSHTHKTTQCQPMIEWPSESSRLNAPVQLARKSKNRKRQVTGLIRSCALAHFS